MICSSSLSAIGWNGFLDLRNSVFIMNVDVAKTEVKKWRQASMDDTVEDISTLTVSEETNACDPKRGD